MIVDEDTAASSPQPRLDPRHRDALRGRPLPPSATRSTRRPAATRRPRCGSRPASPTRSRRSTRAEIYVPFSWFEPMWLENLGFAAEGEGWKLTEAGETAMDGKLPVNCSGGVLSSNPIGASGMLRFAEAALQVRGAAGEHQVDGARRALGPRLRRRLAVLRDVGRRRRQAEPDELTSSFVLVDRPRPRGRGRHAQPARADELDVVRRHGAAARRAAARSATTTTSASSS